MVARIEQTTGLRDLGTSDLHEVRSRIDRIFERQRAHRAVVGTTTADQRIAKLTRLLDSLYANREKMRDALRADFGKPAVEVDLTEVYVSVSEAKHAIAHLPKWMKPKRVAPPVALATTRSEIRYEPKGVVLIISPWNYPFNLTFGPLVSAIAAGNCICVKPSEYTPNCSRVIREMLEAIFPEEELAVFEGEKEVAVELLKKPFDHIFFTGSPEVGKHVMRAAADHLTSVTLELGGKSPCIVTETADLEDAAQKIAWGKFTNNGQTCIAPDYVLVHESRHDAFVDGLKHSIRKFYGETEEARRSSPDYARIVTPRHAEMLEKMLDRSVALGARVEIGGVVDTKAKYVAPTVLTHVDLESPVMQQEIFGPLLPVVSYRSLDEALRIVGERPKPLALYLFSQDGETTDRVLAHTSAGGTCVNDVILQFLNLNLPFGGVNNSGHGSSHGIYGFRAFSHERSVVRHHRASILKLAFPPYGKLAKRLVEITLRYL